jgi:Domain of Unknown Function (DUF1080).
MKRMLWIGVASIATAVAGCSHMESMMGGGDGWETLFDGRSLDNFDRVGDANWRLENGLAVADKGQGFLLTKKSYKDFTIRAEFWAEPDTNSGVFIRCNNRKDLTAANCYEFNIWDTRPGQEYSTGGIVDVAKVNPPPKAAGKWNTYEITARGDQLISVLNGVKVAEGRNAKLHEGPFGLQRFNGNDKTSAIPVKFRKVQIKAL